MEMDNSKNKNQLQIEIKEEVGQGVYSNLAIISHSNTEFVLDFIRVMPDMPKAHVKSRIILTAEHAKRLQLALAENITKYEANHGKIKNIESNNNPIIPFGFGGPTAQA
jgi:hypothetical protein